MRYNELSAIYIQGGMKVISEMIKRRRKEKGYTLSELSRKTGVSKSYLSYLERNMKKNPSIDVVKRIFLTLDLPLSPLLHHERIVEDLPKQQQQS